jgi:hypothetical protein
MPAVKLGPDFFNDDAQAGGFFPNTHINLTFDVEQYLQPRGKNCIIEGIRGTGKTHILKMVEARYIEDFAKYRVIPVYISLAQFSQFSDNMPRFRMQLYANIVLQSICCIEANKDKISYIERAESSSALNFLKKLFRINPDRDFNATIREIKRLNQSLLQKLTYNPQSVSIKHSETEKQAVQMTLMPISEPIVEVATESENEKKVDYVGTNLSHENSAAFILQYFKQLRKILSLNYSLLLLDECSESTKQGQIEVFRLLKTIRGAAVEADTRQNFAYFLAAAYPPQGTYYPAMQKGDAFNFELGHDASVDYLELDETLEEYDSFFAELTVKRLQHLGGNGYTSEQTKVLDIFDNEKAFTLAAYAANGIPRRYIAILKQAYANLQSRTAGSQNEAIQRIGIRDIETAMQSIVSNHILVQGRLIPRDFAILDEVVKRFSKRNKNQETQNVERARIKEEALPATVYFTVSRSQLDELAHLIIQGAIHDKDRTRAKKEYREESSQGELMSLDLAVAFCNGAISKPRAAEIFKNDLKHNAKRGYKWCSDINISKAQHVKDSSTTDTMLQH